MRWDDVKFVCVQYAMFTKKFGDNTIMCVQILTTLVGCCLTKKVSKQKFHAVKKSH